MLILAHECPGCPKPEHTWIAAFYQEAKSEKLKRLPVVFFGHTREEAVSKAEAWWQEEQQKQQRLVEQRERLKNLR